MRETKGQPAGNDRGQGRATARSRCRSTVLVGHRHVRRRRTLRLGAAREQARRAHRRAHDRPRRGSRSWSSCPTAAASGSRRPATCRPTARRCTKRGSSPRVRGRPARRRVRPDCRRRRIPILDKALEQRRAEEGGLSARRRAPAGQIPDSSTAVAFAILSVRLTPVFSRRRRVAQRLERLLDTQEVGGSSPPVPTSLRYAVGAAASAGSRVKADAERQP